jgi:hypothetical protein
MPRRLTQHLKTTVVTVMLTVAHLDAQDATRQIWDSAFRQQRPSPESGGSRTSDAQVSYRTDAGRPAPVTPATRVFGLTLWRLRPSTEGGRDAARLLVQERPDARVEFAPQRIAAGTPLRKGERVRIGVEVSVHGYLYVIDRERRADGSTGPPYLIFPATNLRDGDNRVTPGRLVEIPGQSDVVPALLVSGGREHVGEELLLLVTSALVAELEPARGERRLRTELVERLEKQYGTAASRLDRTGPAEERWWSPSEREAGTTGRLLTQADPMPEMLFRTEQRSDGVLVRVMLPVE